MRSRLYGREEEGEVGDGLVPAVALWRLGVRDRQHSVGVPYQFLYWQRAAGSVRGCVGARCYGWFKAAFRKSMIAPSESN